MEHDTHVMPHNMDEYEVAEWLESLDSVLESSGPEVAVEILERLRAHAKVAGLNLPFTANTPYVNTIPARLEAPFPGDQELERRGQKLPVIPQRAPEPTEGARLRAAAYRALAPAPPGSDT